MRYYPISLDTQNITCLIVGGGEVAIRKIESLLQSESNITVITLKAHEQIKTWEKQKKLTLHLRAFAPSDLNKKDLVIATTDNTTFNAYVSQLAQEQKILVNVVDNPELSSYITPAIINRGALQIALSSSGQAPYLLSHLRIKLESAIPPGYGALAEWMGQTRQILKEKGFSMQDRRRFWDEIFESPIYDRILQGEFAQAKSSLENALKHTQRNRRGAVYLVGAGPGDPDLLTIKALRFMQKADVVLYDRLVAKPLLNYVRKDAERIYVGKSSGQHTITQEAIEQTMITLAKKGQRVLRLKGGDPFLFGRGGEEIETLFSEGIDFQVVPGITAAMGCGSYAGIPLTHRDHAHSCIFVTGHVKDNQINLNWKSLVMPKQTVVCYMGIAGISIFSQMLMQHGMRHDMPTAIIEHGTKPQQRIITGTISTITDQTNQASIRPPAIIIVGNVVKLHTKLGWFQSVAKTKEN